MVNVKRVDVAMDVSGYEDVKVKIDDIAARAEALKREHPEISPQIDSTKALLQAGLLREELKRELSGAGSTSGGLGGLLSGAASGLGDALGAIPGIGGPLASAAGSNPYASAGLLAAVATAAGAAAVGITAVVSGIAGATAGVAAFGALAIPTITGVTGAYTALGTAQTAYQTAVATQAADPTAAHAADVATALLNLQVVQKGMDAPTKTAVGAITQMVTAYDGMAAKLQPDVFKVFNAGLKVANTLLPLLLTPAKDAATALDGLLTKANGFASSKGFQDWLTKFETIIGPAITSIGAGIGRATDAAGKLLTILSSKDDAHAISIVFGTIAVAIESAAIAITVLRNAFDVAERYILIDLGNIVGAAADAFGWIPGIGGQLKTAQRAFDLFALGVEGDAAGIQKSAGGIVGAMAAAGAAAANAFNAASGPGSAKLGHLAAGGYGSGLTLVGEQGPELLSLPAGSYVYNSAQTRRMESGGGGGGTVVNYTINVGAAANPAEAGRLIVNAIRSFEARSGQSWRKH